MPAGTPPRPGSCAARSASHCCRAGDLVADLVARRLAFLTAPSAGVISAIVDPLLAGPTAVAVITDDQLAVCVAPLAAIVTVARAGGAWSVTLDRALGKDGLCRPIALCLLP